ncbi:MAG: hypothetical protein ACTSRC_08280 [Candidatus Helarchaeota archaeon]
MKIWCKNCGYSRELDCTEMEKLRIQKRFQCSKCNKWFELLEIELECPMQKKWFTDEEEVRCVLVNGSLKQGALVWDCRGEAGKCPDPLRAFGIPMILKSGDFFIFWNDRYYSIEVKLAKNRCGKGGRTSLYYGKRKPPEIKQLQMNMLLGGGGVLVIVAEPTLTQEGFELGGYDNKRDCEKALIGEFKTKLGTGEIPYEVWILNQTRFKKVYDDSFGAKPFFNEPHLPLSKRRKRLGFNELKKSVPESRIEISITDFHNGRIMEIILQYLSGLR